MPRRSDVRSVKSQVTTSIGTVQLINADWLEASELCGLSPDHHLQLAVMPQVRNALAGFPQRWGPHRTVRMGETFFLPADHEVHIFAPPQVQHSIACVFSPTAFERFSDPTLEWTDSRLQAGLDVASPIVRNLLFRIGQELRAPRFRNQTLIELMMGQVLIELTRYLMDVDDRETGGGLAPWRVKLIDERLQADAQPPTLDELADLCRLSVRHLTRAFRASSSRSIGSYIAEFRIERAKMMLLSGMAVKAVAAQMNFTQPGNFTAAFRRETGETPREFQKRKIR